MADRLGGSMLVLRNCIRTSSTLAPLISQADQKFRRDEGILNDGFDQITIV